MLPRAPVGYVGDGTLHGSGERLEVTHMNDGVMGADQFKCSKSLIGGGGERLLAEDRFARRDGLL